VLELRDWLVAEKVTLVVLEATGDYWRGAFYLTGGLPECDLGQCFPCQGSARAQNRCVRRYVAVSDGRVCLFGLTPGRTR
jgi:hypothetical protein